MTSRFNLVETGWDICSFFVINEKIRRNRNVIFFEPLLESYVVNPSWPVELMMCMGTLDILQDPGVNSATASSLNRLNMFTSVKLGIVNLITLSAVTLSR